MAVSSLELRKEIVMHFLLNIRSDRRSAILVGLLLVFLALTILLLIHGVLVPKHGPFFAPTAVEYAYQY
jgi:hypothetical protein